MRPDFSGLATFTSLQILIILLRKRNFEGIVVNVLLIIIVFFNCNNVYRGPQVHQFFNYQVSPSLDKV